MYKVIYKNFDIIQVRIKFSLLLDARVSKVQSDATTKDEKKITKFKMYVYIYSFFSFENRNTLIVKKIRIK